MNIRQFEELVRNRNMKPAKRCDVDGMCIVICDGRKPDGHYQTWYAVGQNDDKLEYAHVIEFHPYTKVRGIEIPTTYEMREKAVLEFIKDSAVLTKKRFKDDRKLIH